MVEQVASSFRGRCVASIRTHRGNGPGNGCFLPRARICIRPRGEPARHAEPPPPLQHARPSPSPSRQSHASASTDRKPARACRCQARGMRASSVSCSALPRLPAGPSTGGSPVGDCTEDCSRRSPRGSPGSVAKACDLQIICVRFACNSLSRLAAAHRMGRAGRSTPRTATQGSMDCTRQGRRARRSDKRVCFDAEPAATDL